MQHDIECSMDRSCEKVSRWSGGKEQDMEQGLGQDMEQRLERGMGTGAVAGKEQNMEQGLERGMGTGAEVGKGTGYGTGG